jgi:hypothetical protein
MQTAIALFLILLFFHYLADYPLQGPFLAQYKSSREDQSLFPWKHIMFAHAYIHAGFVGGACWLLTGAWWLMFFELAAHFIIDKTKCEGKINFVRDQWLHIGCKALWAVIAVLSVGVLNG